MTTQYYPETPQPANPYPDENYNPGLLDPPGYGQGVSNPAPPIFIESLAVNNDLSVGGSQYVTKTLNVQGVITGSSDQQLSGNLAVKGFGSFGGVVSAAGFTYGGRSFFGSNQFVVEAPATFLNTLKAAGTSSFEGVITAVKGLVAKALSVAPIPPGFNGNTQSVESVNPPYYQPTDSDGNPIQTPIEFVPCIFSELPKDAVVLAYLPNQNFN
jgi:hypothetical protein